MIRCNVCTYVYLCVSKYVYVCVCAGGRRRVGGGNIMLCRGVVWCVFECMQVGACMIMCVSV